MRARSSFHAASAVARVAALLALAQAALVACSGQGDTATDAPAVQASANVAPARFAIRAQRGARIQEGAEVKGADVGVVLPAPASITEGYSLRLDTHATVSEGARLIAPAMLLAHGSVSGEVLTDELYDRGSTHGAVSPFVPVPPVEPLAAVAAGDVRVTVSRKVGRTLPPGAYGEVVVEPRAILRLEGGEYELASLRVAPGGSVIALATSRVRIAASLDAGSDTRITIADGAGSARDLRIDVAGADATSAAALEDVETPAARLGEGSSVRALISAPAGALVVGARASVWGAVVANAVLVRTRASVGFEDGFEPPICLGGCDDGNPCTADACVVGECRHDPLAADAPCSDGTVCNGDETCDGAGACLAGAAPAVDDANPCTADACDATSGVSHLPLAAGTSCTDADACNGEETCDGAGACLAGVAPALDDGNSCTADACDATGGVSHLPLAVGTGCADADACNGLEICDGAGACLAGVAPPVDDGNPCTADACDATNGVSHLPLAVGASCTDANACNGHETCDGAGACLAGAAPALDDANPCTADACDATSGVSHLPLAVGASCADANACNGHETCDGAGACLAGAAPALDDANPCTADACEATNGVSHLPLAAGASCTDANACNGLEICDGRGACLAAVAPVVDDGDPCTTDACDPVSGVSHTRIADCRPDTSFADGIAYLYTGEGAVQLGVQPGAIDPALAAVVRGKVLLRDGGTPAGGVEVDVFDHPELGHTLTRADGTYEMAVNGGAAVVLRYSGYGAPTVHRSVDAAIHAHTAAADVALIRFDVAYTFIMPALPSAQVARGTRVGDANGSRQATLIFQPDTSARMELPGGDVVPLELFLARASEYTVGANGPRAVPATLPAGFAYQYTVEPSVDDAIVAGGEVAFSAPVALYVENYRAFAVGARLPVARYDRSIAAWLPQADGLVLKLLAVSGGVAVVDVDGDGAAETSSRLAALGIGTPELQLLATLYPAGRSLWRVSLERFGPIACDAP